MHHPENERNSERILLCSAVLLRGGTETHMLALVRTIRNAGWTPMVCCYHEWLPEVAEEFESAQARLHLFNLPRSRNPLPLTLALSRVVHQEQPALAHAQYLAPGFTAICALRRAGLRNVIATVHYTRTRTTPTPHRFLLGAAARLCRRFLAVSKQVERSWFGSSQVWTGKGALPARRHLTVYNGVQPGSTEPGTRAERVRHPVIGVVGRLAREKGHASLLEAFARVREVFPEASLLVVGDGPEATALRERVHQLGITEHVRWHGACQRDTCLQLYSQMDVLAVPSFTEGFGLVAAEAMAAGLPVVANHAGGLPEVIEHGFTGWLVTPGKTDEMAARLVQVLSDPDLAARMSTAAVARVAAHFSLERFESAMRRIYESCLANRDRRPPTVAANR